MFAIISKIPALAVLFAEAGGSTATGVDWNGIFSAVDWNGLSTGWTDALPFIAVPLGVNYTARNVWRSAKKGMRSVGHGA